MLESPQHAPEAHKLTYPLEVRQQAIELRLAGHTLREIEEKLSVSQGIAHLWCQDLDHATATTARQNRIFEAQQEITLEAASKVLASISEMSHRDAIRTLSVASLANQGSLRLLRDEAHANSVLDEIRQLLRHQPPAQLRALTNPAPADPPPNPGLQSPSLDTPADAHDHT